MFLSIDPSSGVPIYRQITEQVKLSIARGALRPDDRLPSVRQLALDLKVNPTTIVKAYSELEHAGIIHTRRGMGTFVSAGGVEVDRGAQRRTLERLAERLALQSHHYGWPADEVVKLFRERLAETAPDAKGDLKESNDAR